MISRFLLLLSLIAFFKFSSATTITSSQDGNWEDSSTWNNISVADTLLGDTVIIKHHISFSHNILLSNCYLQIDSTASLCGHDSITLYYSQLWEYGGLYAEHVVVQSSQWKCYHGFWLVIVDVDLTGVGSQLFLCCGCGGKVGGCFICNNPVEICPNPPSVDSTSGDAINIPPKLKISITVFPNPTLDYFNINSAIPDSNSIVTLNIFDLIGREIKTISIPAGNSVLTVFTNDWVAGIYLLRFMDGETVFKTEKLVMVR